VNDLVARLDISQPGVSKHLKVLRKSGLVAVRRDGRRRWYGLRALPLAEVDMWLEPYRQSWPAASTHSTDTWRRIRNDRSPGEQRRPSYWDRCFVRLEALLRGEPMSEKESLERWSEVHERYAAEFGVDPRAGAAGPGRPRESALSGLRRR
jgi:DNA-binding transcriptional ArsR family regulator